MMLSLPKASLTSLSVLTSSTSTLSSESIVTPLTSVASSEVVGLDGLSGVGSGVGVGVLGLIVTVPSALMIS